MKYTHQSQAITDILREIKDKELIPHPQWQRDYIWELEDQKDLIDSIMRTMPIGVIYVWEKEDEDEGDIKLTVDGQQRITTLEKFVNNEFKDMKGKFHREYDRKQLSIWKKYRLKIEVIELKDEETELDIL